MLTIGNLSGGYRDKLVVEDISFRVEKGEVLGILGPNGSGKSTLLKIISGVLPTQKGFVLIDDQDVKQYSTKEFARKVAVLPQMHAHTFSHTVRETVSLGRYPYQSGIFSTWSEQDERAIQSAMESTGIIKYEQRSIEFLSGGEQQRVFVAQALAQETQILLLDEPTNHLDIAHQQQLLDVIAKQAKEKGLTVIAVFHDINLASLYCNRLLLLDNGRISKIGTPQEVVKEHAIEKVYKARVRTGSHPELPKPQVTLLPNIPQEAEKKVTMKHFVVSADYVLCVADQPLKVVSSAVHNPGIGWYRYFINRHVDRAYHYEDIKSDMAQYLEAANFPLTDSVAMMTSVPTNHVEIGQYEGEFCSVIVAVTAGLGNVVERESIIGPINMWVMINGHLADETFIQAMMTATEAKAKALQDEQVKGSLTETMATGTSTDSILLAATQQGALLQDAGPVTPLGKLVAKGVYHCTVRAINTYKEVNGWLI